MKRETYLKGLLAFLLLMVGANPSWADDVVLTPSLSDTQLRLSNTMSYTTAEIETHKQASSGVNNYDFSGLMQFNISGIKAQMAQGYRVKSVSLRLTNSTNQTKTITVKGISYAWNGSSNIAWNDISSTLVTAASGSTLATVSMVKGEDALCDLGKNKGTSDTGKAGTWNIANWQAASASTDAMVNYVATAAASTSDLMQFFLYVDDSNYTSNQKFFSVDVSGSTYNTASDTYTWTSGTGWSKTATGGSTRFAEIKKYLGYDTDEDLIAQLVPVLTVTLEPVNVLNQTTNTGYENLASAISAVSANDVIVVRTNQELGATTIDKAITLKAGVDGVKISRASSVANNAVWLQFTGATTESQPLQIGGGTNQLVFDGGNVTNATADMIRFKGSGDYSFITNVKFQNYTTSTYALLRDNAGKVTMQHVAIDNCGTTANDKAIIENEKASGVVFAGENAVTFNNCSGNELSLKKGMRYEFNAGATISTNETGGVIDIYLVDTSFNELALIFANEATKTANYSKFNIVNSTIGLYNSANTTKWEYKTTEAKTVTIGESGYATFVTPFAATVPTGVTVYDVTYSSGSAVTTAASSQVADGKLAANKPVLLQATAGDYKFVNPNSVTEATTGSGTHTNGALTGVYEETPAPADSYILSGNIFQKSNGENVAANNAYVTATGATTPWLTIGAGSAYTKPFVILGTGDYDTLEGASGALEAVADGGTIYVQSDVTISNQVSFNKNVTIVPTTALTIKRATGLGNTPMFVMGDNKTVTIGSASIALTIDGQSTSFASQLININEKGTLNLVNTTIKNAYSSDSKGIIFAKKKNSTVLGVVSLNGVTFDNCKATADNAGLVFLGANESVTMEGTNTFNDNCVGNHFYLEGRILVTNAITAPATPYTLYAVVSKFTNGGVLNGSVVKYNNTSYYGANHFKVVTPGYEYVLNNETTPTELKLAITNYTVTVDPAVTGGTVTVDKATATIGETVTITATPTGTNLLTGTPTATYGTPSTSLTVTASATAGKYTFEMPAGNVTVGATFTAKATGKVVNETQNLGYATFKEAYDGAASGDVLILNENVEITERIGSVKVGDVTTKKSLTIKPGAAGVTLTRGAEATGMLFNADGVTLNIGSADYQLTIDGNNVSSSAGLFELGQTASSILTLTNVIVKNVKTTSTNGIINVKKGSGGVTLTDVTFKDNTVTNALIRTLDVNTGGMTFGGAFTVSGGTGDFIRLGSGAKLDASTLPAMTTYNIEVEDASPTITNASTPDKFVLTTVGIKKKVDGTTITFESLDSGQDTAIDESAIAATYGDGYKLKPVEATADGWVREDTDKGNGTNGNMEVKTLDGKNFYGFIKLVLPTDATVADADIKKAQIRFVTDVYQGSGWFNIYGFTGDYTESSKYSDLSAAITSTLATTPLKSVQINGQKTKSVSGDTGINEDMKTIDKWTNLVDLTDYVKERKAAGTLTLMLVASTSEDVKNAFFTREASDINNTNSSITVGKANLIPQLNLVYKAGEVALNVTHPAMLHTAADLARVKSNIGLSPVKDAYAHLQASTYAQASYTPSPVQYLKRMDATNWSGTYSDYANYTSAMKDAHAAYQLALRYQLEGSTACADAAVKILNAWASTNKGVLKLSGYTNEIPDPNEYLISIQAHQFANAAELLREYSGWNATDFTAFKAWIKKSFVDDLALPFLQNHHNHVGDKHYWLNWDLAALTSVLSVGILCDDKDLTDYAIDYYKGTVTTTTGHTNKEEVGYYANAIPFVHADDTTIGLGQCQESGRDQGHSLLDVGLLGAFCQMAKNMGTDGADLFAVDDYRALKMAEYVGKYNLNLDVPFTAYNPNAEYNHTAISAEGRGEVRPVWELFYRYAREAGKSASYSQQWAEKLREANAWGEGGGGDYGTASTGFDQLGYGTLIYADPDDDGQDTKIDENAYKDYTIGKRGTQGDTYVRSDNATSKNGTAAQMEIRSNETADFMGLLSFKLPADAVGTVQKAQLRLVTKRKQISRNINIYAYNDFDEASATYTTETSHITTAKKTTPLTGFTPKGQSGLDVTSGGKTMTDANKKLEAWTNYVDLTAYVKELKTRNVNLLLADAGVGTNNNSVQFFTKEQGSLTLDSEGKVAFASEAADLVPQLVVVYTESSTTKTFEVEGEGFATLEDALAEVADGGTILVKGDALVESQVKFDKNVTIKAADGVTPVLKRDATDKVLYLMGSNKTVTFENIIFDENGATDKPLMEINNSQKFVLNNVTIQNSKYKNSDGLLDVKNGTLTLNGVTFKDCAVTYAYIRTAKAEGGGLDFAGKVNFTNSTGDHLLLRGKASVDGSKLLSAITAPITVDINASDCSTLSITNVTDLSKFQLTTDGFTMSLNNGTVTFVKEDDGQDVDDLSKYTGTNSSKSPNADTFVRSTSAETKYGTANNIEVHTNADADFAGLLSFRLPGNAVADGAEIQKVQLRLVTKQKKSNGGINIFRFCDFEEGTATYKTTSDSVAAARKSTAITKFYPKGQTGMDVTSDGSKESFDASYKKIASWENRIDLTAYVKGLKSRTVNLLLSASSDDGQTIQFFSKEWKTALSTAATSDGTASNHAFDASVDELIPQLIVIYQGNGKTNTFVIPDEGSYATLEEALEDVEDGGTILVTANATIGDQISFTKNVTIKSDGNSARILTRGSGAKSVLYKMDKSVTVNFENLIFNENGFTDKPLIEVSGNQHFVLKDVTIQNSNYKNSDGLLDVKDGSLTLDNVTFKDCEVANAFIRTAKANGGGLEFASRLNFVNCTGDHILLRAKASVDGSRLLSAITAPVMVEINGSDYSNLSITNVSDLSKFELMTIGYSMVLRGTTIYFEEESDGQDTEEIEVPEDAELVTVSSLGDTYLRKGNTTDNGKKTTIEVYTYEDGSSDLDFVGLMAFKLPSDLLVEGAVLHKAQLRLVSKRVKGSPIIDMYDLYRDFDESAIYDNMESVVEELRSKERMHRFHARGMAGMDIEADTLKLTEKYKDINEWTNLIDLTGWVDNARYDDGKIRFALMSPLNSKDAKMFYTKEATAIKNSVMTVSKDSLVPQLTLVYTPGTGASTLSAKNIEATPNADTFVRKGSTNDNSVSTCIEVYTYKTDRADIDFVGLLSFDLNDDVQRARSRAKTDELELFSATLRLVTKRVRGERDMNVYVFDEPFSGNSTYDELADAIAKTRADADYVTFKTAGQEGKDITTDSGLTGTYKTSIVPWTNEIDMTGILKGSDTSTLSLMLSAPDNGRSSKQYFSSEAESFTNDNNKDFIVAPEDLVPQLVISYRNPYYTDIEETVIIPVSKTEIIYDLRGNRVETMGKGIYIVNGKKVLKK